MHKTKSLVVVGIGVLVQHEGLIAVDFLATSNCKDIYVDDKLPRVVLEHELVKTAKLLLTMGIVSWVGVVLHLSRQSYLPEEYRQMPF